jgi:transcriptional antiterminator NusG
MSENDTPELDFLKSGDLPKLLRGDLKHKAKIAGSILSGRHRDFTKDAERLAGSIEQAVVVGSENIPLENIPLILAVNHPGIYDVVAGVVNISKAFSSVRQEQGLPKDIHWMVTTKIPPRDINNLYKPLYGLINVGLKMLDHTYKFVTTPQVEGHENKVARTLMQRVQAMGFEERIYDALVPTRDTIRVRGGKKETIKEKIFPGYILVNMDLSDEAWVLVRTTPGVTSFVGAQNKPTPIRDDEVQAIVAFVGQKDPVYKAQFSVGEAVKITDGPFSDFLGTVESIDEAKGKIKVLVSIFGRETPVELDFLQVAKI